MHCDGIKLMLNDFFNKTLSRVEEQKVEGHLSECENCRCEFSRLEKADRTLKKVIHEMVAGIEVPNTLNERIEKVLALEKSTQIRPGRLLSLFKTPAVAAALLLVVLTAGFLSYYNLFGPAATQQKVVMSDSQGGSLSVGSSPADIDNNVTDAGEKAAHNTESQDLQLYDTDIKKGTEEQSVKQPAVEAAKPSPPAVAMSPGNFEDIRTPLEKRSMALSSAPQAAGASGPALSGGTYEEAARDAGFVPAQPTYLPQGMKLEDVSWRSGVVYQTYRNGNSYVTVSQSRAQAAGFNYDELVAGGIPVNINGARAVLEESRRDSSDNISGGYATVRWQSGEWVFSVSGELPAEEIMKIASSLK